MSQERPAAAAGGLYTDVSYRCAGRCGGIGEGKGISTTTEYPIQHGRDREQGTHLLSSGYAVADVSTSRVTAMRLHRRYHDEITFVPNTYR